jgi:mono/diheme cytochrome c family protein
LFFRLEPAKLFAQMNFRFLASAAWIAGNFAALAALTPEQIQQLPPPADHPVNFAAEIKPIFEASCINCHGHGRDKGGFKIDNRETLLKGSDSGAVIVPGKSADSLLISLVQGFDPDSVMPKKGSRLTPQQIGLLRAWIDQGAPWDAAITFARPQPANLIPRDVQPPAQSKLPNPIDRFLEVYFAAQKITAPKPVEDRVFARRAWLDVTGLLPEPAELDKFLADKRSDKRHRLVTTLLARNRDYAENWLTFWNDQLRNDYKGTGYIDGGRKQITKWLFSALLTNMPYNQFVAQLINPTPESEGFTKGIVWRGVVNASQTPQMQAAQGICQVFMGVNLKCASCHDSFINDLTLADSYGLAGIYADAPLEMVRCDKPTGKTADPKFIYSELGKLDPQADRPARLKQLAELITQPKDGRLTRTLVNRLWQRFLGRGLVEPVDDMDKAAWNSDLLDWLADDFVAHNYDVKHLIETILASNAYQLPAVDSQDGSKGFVFHGPLVRRLDAEQFRDALTSLTGFGYAAPAAEVVPGNSSKKSFTWSVPVHWIWNDPHAAEKAKPGRVYFTKTFNLKTVPKEAAVAVVCDNTFTLFVNGQKAGSGSDFTSATVLDVRSFLKAGTNLFAVEAINNRQDNSAPASKPEAGQANPAGLLFYARLRDGGGRSSDLGSDASWLATEQPPKGWEKGTASDGWKPAVDLGDMGTQPWRIGKAHIQTRLAAYYPGAIRASLVAADPLTTALGRPNREQVVTTRSTEATTLQALELTNGQTLADVVKNGTEKILEENKSNAKRIVEVLYKQAVGRPPTARESKVARELLGKPVAAAGVEDLVWAIAMLPEFQLIY